MCRNITELRGLEPAATREEIEAAAAQYIRKVSGITKPNPTLAEAMRTASLEVADDHRAPAGRAARPPSAAEATVPPLRRPEVRARLGLSPI